MVSGFSFYGGETTCVKACVKASLSAELSPARHRSLTCPNSRGGDYRILHCLFLPFSLKTHHLSTGVSIVRPLFACAYWEKPNVLFFRFYRFDKNPDKMWKKPNRTKSTVLHVFLSPLPHRAHMFTFSVWNRFKLTALPSTGLYRYSLNVPGVTHKPVSRLDQMFEAAHLPPFRQTGNAKTLIQVWWFDRLIMAISDQLPAAPLTTCERQPEWRQPARPRA